MPTDHTPIFSVVICTYNRAKLLQLCIQSIINQSFAKIKFEIIIMDDGSTDETILMISKFQKKYQQPNIKYFTQNNLGLAHSRNYAVRMSKGSYIAFLDDDAKADKYWLDNAWKCLNFVKPTPLGITGPVIPYYGKNKSYWFKDVYEEDIKGKISRFLKYGETFSGPNMILKKELIQKYGGFAQDIDMKASILMVGEETKLFERIWEKNPNSKLLYYSTNISIYHLVHPYKMKIYYRLKRWFATGQSNFFRNKNSPFLKRLLIGIKVFIYFFISIFLALLSFVAYPYYQNWIVEKIGPIAFVLGYITALMKIPITAVNHHRT